MGRKEEDSVSHMIFADNCYLLAESKEQILKILGDATEELKKRGLDWEEDEMELISWGFCEDVGDLHIEDGGKKYVIREVEALKAMGALISKEADSMSALKFRMNKADEPSNENADSARPKFDFELDEWEMEDQKFRMMVQKTQNMLDKTDIRPMADHLDMFQHIYRDWNQEADHLTHVARDKGATWNSHIAEAGTRIAAERSFFDGGVSIQEDDDKIKHKVGSACVIHLAERIEESTHKMKWRNH